jgi:predicted methyltransferase
MTLTCSPRAGWSGLAAGICAGLLVSVSPAAAGDDSLASRLASGTRSEADKQRDADRRPSDVIAFLGVEPGMTVIDLIAAGGWYSEVLSVAVGEKGTVYAQNPAYVLQLREGVNDKDLTARLAGDRLPNVKRIDRELAETGIEPGTLDLALTALNFHDIYNARGAEAAQAFFVAVGKLLKPGGVLGLIDHAGGAAGADDEKLHRIDEKLVISSAKAAGFEIVATSDVLRHPEDDRTRQVFEPGLRGNTDRFVLKLRKPAAATGPR